MKNGLIINDYGDKEYWLNDKLHREDGPSVECSDGSKFWFKNGKRHREDGPAIEFSNGSKEWYLNGKRHRKDGPAIEYSNGNKHWYLNGKRHRENGPAIELTNGYKAWFLNGKQVNKEDLFKYEIDKTSKFNIKEITVLISTGTDLVYIKTDLPNSMKISSETLTMKFEVQQNKGIEYIRKNFNIEPKVINIK